MSFSKLNTTIQNTIKSTGASIIDETTEVSKITAGRIAYNNARKLLSPIIPKPKWYENWFISQDRRELFEMMFIFTAIHMFKDKFDNYLTQSITRYINYSLQNKFINKFDSVDMDNLFNMK